MSIKLLTRIKQVALMCISL